MSILPIIFFIIFMLGAMFFSASETAFTAIPQHKITSLLRQKKKGAKALYQLKQTPEKMLTSILIGSNISNIGAASVATVIAVKAALLLQQPQNTIVSISTILVTILMLVFGEIVPKTYATHNAEKVGLWIAPFYTVFTKILSPIVFVLEKLTTRIKSSKNTPMNDEDLEAFINLSKKYGVLENKEDIRIKKVLKLNELTARQIMTPRIKIHAIQDTLTIQEAIKEIIKTPYSRFPVYHKKIDDIDRITTLKELIRYQEEFGPQHRIKNLPLDDCISIPSSQDLNTILSTFQKTHKHLGIVVDEYGGIAGAVSLEDILEEVFGEIQDEADQEINPIIKKENGILCQSYVRLDEALTALDIDFNDLDLDPDLESKTLNYFIIKHIGSFPKKNERIYISMSSAIEEKVTQIIFHILSVNKNTIGEIEIYKK